ncbi:MAG: type VI secretion system baseplate subunit TssE [Paracoccaceae bacterium]|nr:MAG: type VI secretion system baseplate subunit TssE [Paracoccaceae bacterium]
MSENTLKERLQPSLLDRLADNSPGDLQETRDSRVIDLPRLREIIQRDLAWLLNTFDNSSMFDPAEYPNVANSVLTYGVREVAGEFTTYERTRMIQDSMLRAIERFEPRIISGTLKVVIRETEGNNRTLINFDIAGEMWARPLPRELYLRSQVDVTTGEITLETPSSTAALRTALGV